jgi:hypothetical protein
MVEDGEAEAPDAGRALDVGVAMLLDVVRLAVRRRSVATWDVEEVRVTTRLEDQAGRRGSRISAITALRRRTPVVLVASTLAPALAMRATSDTIGPINLSVQAGTMGAEAII